MNFDLDSRTILKVKHGSTCYGLSTPESDLDIKGVAIEPLNHHIGFLNRFEQHIEEQNKGAPNDLTIYSLKKFCKLAADSNPNIIECLFVSNEDVLYSDVFGQRLLEFGPNFLSTRAKHSFSGYAHAQWIKIKNHHNRWLQGLPPLHVKSNPVKAELEARIGMNPKHCMHLIRLLRVCKEMLATGEVNVKRTKDRDYLLAIRRGEIPFADIEAEAVALEAECEALYTKSPLPKEPDRVKLDRFVCDLTCDFLASKGEL